MAEEKDIYPIGGEKMVVKFKSFNRDKLVSMDRENLMFCAKAGCENVFNLREWRDKEFVACDLC